MQPAGPRGLQSPASRLSAAQRQGAAERSRTLTATARRAGARWARRGKRVASCGLRAQRPGQPVSVLPAAAHAGCGRRDRGCSTSSKPAVAYPTATAAGARTAARARRTGVRRRPSTRAPRCDGKSSREVSARASRPTALRSRRTRASAASRAHATAHRHARHNGMHAAGAARPAAAYLGLARRTAGTSASWGAQQAAMVTEAGAARRRGRRQYGCAVPAWGVGTREPPAARGGSSAPCRFAVQVSLLFWLPGTCGSYGRRRQKQRASTKAQGSG